MITDLRPNHSSDEFIRFLNKINRAVPDDLDVHIVLDNLQTHKTPKVHRWLLRHRRFHLHFTPTYSSWLNLVERWFSALTTKKLQRSAHRHVRELAADIRDWVAAWNADPKPFCGRRPPTRSSTRSAATAAPSLMPPPTPINATLQPYRTLGFLCSRRRLQRPLVSTPW